MGAKDSITTEEIVGEDEVKELKIIGDQGVEVVERRELMVHYLWSLRMNYFSISLISSFFTFGNGFPSFSACVSTFHLSSSNHPKLSAIKWMFWH